MDRAGTVWPWVHTSHPGIGMTDATPPPSQLFEEPQKMRTELGRMAGLNWSFGFCIRWRICCKPLTVTVIFRTSVDY